MQTVKSSWHIYFKVLSVIDAVLFAATIVAYVLCLIKDSYSLCVWTIVLVINSAVWFIFVAICFVRSTYEDDKLKCLKINSICYEGKVERTVRNHGLIRIGSMMSCYAECSYQNEKGKSCLVRSGSFMLEYPNADYNVAVYVSRMNPADYAVELSVVEKTSVQYDFDYRYEKLLASKALRKVVNENVSGN